MSHVHRFSACRKICGFDERAQKFDNYVSNLAVLSNAEKEDLENEFVISGIADKFFIQFEIGWKVLKELLRYEGMSVANMGSPREIIKAAYVVYDYLDEEVWLSMLRARNDMTHIYDGDAAKRMVEQILTSYIPEFCKLQKNILDNYGKILELI